MAWAAFSVACLAILLLRPLAGWLGLIDQPGGRKTHHGAVPVVGGLAMFAGLVVSLWLERPLGAVEVAVVALGGALLLLGALDDRFNVAPRVRLLAHLSAGALLVWATGCVVQDLGDLFGLGSIRLGWLALPLTVVAVVAMINAFNMLDGLDGLAGGSALVAFATLTAVAAEAGDPVLVVICSSVTGVVAGFLLFNLPLLSTRRFRVFMGDAGSTLLGFMVAAVALLLVQDPGPAVAPALILWLVPIPIFELFWTTFRRLRSGLSLALADDGHWHHVLVRAGLSVRTVFLIYVVFSGAAAAAGLSLQRAGRAEPVLFLGFIGLFGAWLLLMRYVPLIAALVYAMRRERRVPLPPEPEPEVEPARLQDSPRPPPGTD